MIVVAAALLAWATACSSRVASRFSPAATTPTSVPPPSVQGIPAVAETRRLTLEWPPTLRAGDSDTIRLTLEVDALGKLTPTAEVGGHEVGGEVVTFPNLYDTHNVWAEAWLDIAGVNLKPDEHVSQPLLPGQSVTFYWSVQPEKVGDYRGTAWLKLHFIPKAGGESSERVISAQRLEIRAVNLLGMGGAPARLLGGVGLLLGSLLSLDGLVEWGWKRLQRRKSLPEH